MERDPRYIAGQAAIEKAWRTRDHAAARSARVCRALWDIQRAEEAALQAAEAAVDARARIQKTIMNELTKENK